MKILSLHFRRNSFLGQGCLLAAALFVSATSQAATLYNLSGTVLDGGTGENTYFVSNTTSAGAGSGLSYNAGTPSLTWTQGANSNQFTYMLGYLGSAAVLTNVGDSISLSYTIAVSGTNAFSSSIDGNFRVGLLNSGGSKITGNLTGTGSTTFNSYGGYVGYYRANGTPTATDSFYQRSGTNAVLPTSNGTPALTPTLVSPGTSTITGSFTITKLASGVQLDSVINGGAVQSITDTTSVVTTFDTFTFLAYGGASNAALTFSNLTVATVPEPSTWALLGLGGAALIYLRRRTKIRS